MRVRVCPCEGACTYYMRVCQCGDESIRVFEDMCVHEGVTVKVLI